MDIQQLHLENNACRDIIISLKGKINELDRHIQANEIEIGRQLQDMQRLQPLDYAADSCEMCMGECDTGCDHE